jgi:preprotein translocase subunit SecG
VDGFRDNMDLLGTIRISQVIALAVALVCVVLLARDDVSHSSSGGGDVFDDQPAASTSR